MIGSRTDGLTQWPGVADLYETWGEIVDVRALDDRLVVVFVIRGSASGSGIPNEETLAQVITMGQGKIRKARDYRSPAEALEAVGLSE